MIKVPVVRIFSNWKMLWNFWIVVAVPGTVKIRYQQREDGRKKKSITWEWTWSRYLLWRWFANKHLRKDALSTSEWWRGLKFVLLQVGRAAAAAATATDSAVKIISDELEGGSLKFYTPFSFYLGRFLLLTKCSTDLCVCACDFRGNESLCDAPLNS